MKRLIAKSLMLAGGLTLSAQLMALGLGELTLKSALNQPLTAEIELVDAQDLSKWEIKPSLATTADFERAGVDRVFFLTKIKFTVEDGKVVLSSREAVTEPFLNFLVELNWPSGRVLREYTVLLDPPVFEEESIRPLVVTPAATEVTSTASVQVQPQQGGAVSRQGNDWLDNPAAPGTYKVQTNDTLWQIALQTRPDSSVSPQQMMLAIQQQNPNAFINGNINRLKSHQVLRIPDAGQVAGIQFGKAVAEVERQNEALEAGAAQLDATGRRTPAAPVAGGSDGGEVRLLSAGAEQAESAGASGDVAGDGGTGRQQALENDLAIALETLDKSRLENQELRQRLESLEGQIETLQRLITLKDDQLANIQTTEALQQEAGVEQAEATEAAAVVAEDAEATAENAAANNGDVTEAPEGEVAADESAPVDTETTGADVTEEGAAADDAEATDFNYQDESTAADDSVNDTVVQQEAAAQEAAEAKAREERRKRIAAMLEEQNRPQPTLMDTILQRPEFLAGGLLLILLIALAAYKLVQARKAAKGDDADEFDGADVAFADGDVHGADLDDLEFDEAELTAAELDLGHDNELDLGVAGDDAPLDDFDDEHADAFAPVAQTEDVISESDIYIAYGKFEQAVDLLQGAIAQEPSRSDLRLKLLEVFVEMDDAEAFASQEADLIAIGDQDANGQAEQMRGRLSTPIAPELLASDAQGGLSLNDDIPSLDDSLGEEFSEGLDFGDALDLADGADDLEDDAPAEADLNLGGDDALDFDLSSAVDEIPSLTEEAPLDNAADSSLEDVPTLDLDESLEFDLDAESNGLDLSDDAEDTAEFELPAADDADDALEFDLSSLDEATDSDADADDVAVAAESSDDNALDFDLGELAADEGQPEAEQSTGDEVIDISDAADDDDAPDLADLESLLDADGSTGDDELSDLSFDMDESTGFAESADDDLKALEAELDSASDENVSLDEPELDEAVDVEDVVTEAQESAADEQEVDFAADLAELDAELDDFSAPAEEHDIPVVDEPLVDEAPVADSAEQSPAAAADQDIDLDKLAAADDEFDFLAGTDECATKLDLARAYIDMEDSDGARELLQEVLQEGSDQQKQDARSLMDTLS